MLSLDERIAKSKEKVLQLERQKRTKEKKEQELKRKTDIRRKIIVGEIFTRHFPEILQLTPQKTDADTNVEFAPLDDFLSMLAADKDWSVLLTTETTQKKPTKTNVSDDTIRVIRSKLV